jgi:hypothetical protein
VVLVPIFVSVNVLPLLPVLARLGLAAALCAAWCTAIYLDRPRTFMTMIDKVFVIHILFAIDGLRAQQ